MPDLLAKATAVAVAALLVVVIGVLVVTSRPPPSATEVVAEFDDAFPLIEGMHVRVDGAIAGSVGPIEVNERGNAEVTLLLNEAVEQPRADARAVISQQDTTGDSYVAFEPNPEGAEEPLGPEGLSCEVTARGESCPQTMIAPRLDDLLNAFDESERAGVKLILTELATALEQRGDTVHDAAFELKPALELANTALGEVNRQNDALKNLISSAESVTGQAAERGADLDRLISGLEQTLAATAEHDGALDAGLERLPATTSSARSTLAGLRRAATQGRPLADRLAEGAPALATAIERLPGFLDDAKAGTEASVPTLRLTRRVLNAAKPSLEVGNERVVTGLFDFTGAASELINAAVGGTGERDNDGAFPALFDDDSYGVGEGTLGGRGFGAVAVQPGDLPLYPPEHEPRNFLRVSAIINCAVFGVPVEPGCLADVIAGGVGEGANATQPAAGSGVDRAPGAVAPRAAQPDNASPRSPALELPDLDLGGRLSGLAAGSSPAADDGHRKQGPAGRGRAISDLLDFLIGP